MKIYYWHDKLFFIWYLFLNPAQEFILHPRLKKPTYGISAFSLVMLLLKSHPSEMRIHQPRNNESNMINYNEIKTLWYSLREHDPYNFLNCCYKNIHLSGIYFLPVKSTTQLLKVSPGMLTCENLSSSPKLFPHLLWEAKWRPSEKKKKIAENVT